MGSPNFEVLLFGLELSSLTFFDSASLVQSDNFFCSARLANLSGCYPRTPIRNKTLRSIAALTT
jgi:hypothetical protein